MSSTHLEQLSYYIENDKMRYTALELVRDVGLPDCYIGAGFVRNLVWDKLHNRNNSTPLSDVDVIYFDDAEQSNQQHTHEATLKAQMPELNWEVRNQAFMHIKHGHSPYRNTEEAITHWVECETAVAVRLNNTSIIEVLAPFGLSSLFNGFITPNPGRELRLFEQRLAQKQWLKKWPNLRIKTTPS